MAQLSSNRSVVSAACGMFVGLAAFLRFPFPEENGILQFVSLQKPVIFQAIKVTYVAMLFTTPCIAFSMLLSLVYIFLVRRESPTGLAKLPMYPASVGRDKLFVVVGEIHHPKKPEPAENPQWLTIPNRGLYTGIAVFGAIGSGKTS